MGLWTEYKKKSTVDSIDTILVYDPQNGVRQVTGEDLKKAFWGALDATLQMDGIPADAGAVGKKIGEIEGKINDQSEVLASKAEGGGITFFYDEEKGCVGALITAK